MRRIPVMLTVLLLVLAACQPAAIEITATPSAEPLIPTETGTPDITATPRAPLTPRATLPPEPTETPTETLTSAPTRMRTERPTITMSPTSTATQTFTSTFTPTDTLTFTPTATFTSTHTPTPTITPSLVRTPSILLPFGARFTYTTFGASVELIDLSGGDIESWLWDFGDGKTSDSTDTTHFYEAGGRYVVTLTIRGEGKVSTAIRAIDLTPHKCVLAPIGRARVHVSPNPNSQTIFYMIGDHRAETTYAVIGTDGEIWYRSSSNSWMSASRYRVESGLCPLPAPPEP